MLATAVTFPIATADWSTLLAPTLGWGLFDTLGGSIATSMWYQSPFVSSWFGVTAVTTGNKFTAPGTTYTNGQTVILEAVTGVSLPGGFSADTVYYVVSASGDTFSLAATSGGSAITVTSDGAGIVGVIQAQAILNGSRASFLANALSIQAS